jgi:hypothetical protein
MSQIKLLHSGGNGVSIVAPDSNPASDRTLKLPSDGDGTILTTNSSVGKILQVVSNEKSDTVSMSGQNGGDGSALTFQNVSGINVTITPTAASSKIHVEFCLGKVHHSGNSTGVRFTRSVAGGTATAIKLGDADGNRSRVTTNIIGQNQINETHSESFNFTFIDTPSYSVGQAIVYQMQVCTENSSNFYVNRNVNNDNQVYVYRARAFSNIIAMEIAA